MDSSSSQLAEPDDAHPRRPARSPSLSSLLSTSTTSSLSPHANTNPNKATRPPRRLKPRIRIRAEQLRTYPIDLSLPPSTRHAQICAAFLSELTEFTQLYHSILSLTGFPKIVGACAKVLLRKVYDAEEAAEIRGIARASGLPLHEVVAYNTFLDLFSGCVSGGVRTSAEGGGGDRMLHFRGLDWEMDCLRDLLVRVEYVRDGKVVARAVTYAGYVGTLTGVREGLSISMNYRLRITSNKSVFSHRVHQLALLMGLRPSIASQLRRLLLKPGPAPSLEEVKAYFEETPTAPCYLTFCSPDEVMVIENDLGHRAVKKTRGKKAKGPSVEKNSDTEANARSASSLSTSTGATATHNPKDPSNAQTVAGNVQTSREFLAVTNHDREMEGWSHEQWMRKLEESGLKGDSTGVAHGLMANSMDRKECISLLWASGGRGGPVQLRNNVSGESGSEDPTRVREEKKELGVDEEKEKMEEGVREGEKIPVELGDVKEWLRTYPLRNETTHFSCIMDPSVEGGGMLWVEACEEV